MIAGRLSAGDVVARTPTAVPFLMSPPRRGPGVWRCFFEIVLPLLAPTRRVLSHSDCQRVHLSTCTRQRRSWYPPQLLLVRQLPLPMPGSLEACRSFVAPRVLELCYTAWEMAPIGLEFDYRGPPFRWDTERRALIRAELDALMFRIYGIERSDIAYILDSFEGVGKDDMRRWDEYRTRRLILERYDRWSKPTIMAMLTGPRRPTTRDRESVGMSGIPDH